jgi:hypothetical protein
MITRNSQLFFNANLDTWSQVLKRCRECERWIEKQTVELLWTLAKTGEIYFIYRVCQLTPQPEHYQDKDSWPILRSSQVVFKFFPDTWSQVLKRCRECERWIKKQTLEFLWTLSKTGEIYLRYHVRKLTRQPEHYQDMAHFFNCKKLASSFFNSTLTLGCRC